MAMHRDFHILCPRCGAALVPPAAILVGERLVCQGCSGSLVTEAGLAELMAAMKIPDYAAAEVTELPLQPFDGEASDPQLGCPLCVATMERHTLLGVIIDRCPAHGIWLDADELDRVLAAATPVRKDPGFLQHLVWLMTGGRSRKTVRFRL